MNTSVMESTETGKGFSCLSQSVDRLQRSVDGLSDAQWNFKPNAEAWTIANQVEHLAMGEHLFLDRIVPQFPGAPAPEAGRMAEDWDGRVMAIVADRSVKYKAPPQLVPTGHLSGPEAMAQLIALRARTAKFWEVSASCCRDRLVPHPAIGPVDIYQWVLFMAGHVDWHVAQIDDIKASAHFPAF